MAFDINRKSFIILLAVMIFFGILLRLPSVKGYSAYAYHELSRDMAVIKGISSGNFPLFGTTSSLNDFHFGPVYYYLYFPIAYFTGFAPYSLAVTSLVFSILTILLGCYVIMRFGGDKLLVILFAFITCFSMGDIQFAKYGSNPNPVPFFSLLFFYALKNLFDNKGSLGNTVMLAASFAIAFQLHTIPMICLPVILFISIASRKLKFNLTQIGIFVLVCLVLCFPYIYHEINSDFYDFKQLIALVPKTDESAGIVARFSDTLGFIISPLISANNIFDAPYLIGRSFVYFAVLMLLIVSPFAHFDKRFSKKPVIPSVIADKNLKNMIMLWALVPMFILVLPIGSVVALHPYYFFILSPLLFFVWAYGIYMFFRKGMYITGNYLLVYFILLQIVQYGYYQKIFINHL